MDYVIQNRTDYSKELLFYKAKIKIRCYSRRQMKALYPHGNFIVMGEIGNKTGIQCGTAKSLDGQPLPVYKEKTYNSLTEAVVGYAAVDNHTYLAVIKNDLLKRIAILFFILALVAAGAAALIIIYTR